MDDKHAVLIEDCIRGDETAITYLIEQYQHGVFKLTLSVLGDAEEANEATQDTFIVAIRSLKSYRELHSFKAWLFKIALNLSRNRLRKRKVLKRLQQNLTAIIKSQPHEPSPEQTVLKNEENFALWDALNALSEKHRIPIVLRYFLGLPVAEIAEIMSLKEGTVHSRLSIGRNTLRTHMKCFYRNDGVE